MKKRNQKASFLSHALNVITIALIVECFLCAMMSVRKYARDDCFDRIEETTAQMSLMFTHAMDERRDKLTVFADILGANSENPDALLQTYMENFCRTQYFSALCIHRRDGRITAYGNHSHDEADFGARSFDEEVARLPYISDVFSQGNPPEENFIYQAVPIRRNGEILAVLYGYMSLDVLPDFIASSAYDGKCQFYVVNGDTGDFLMDEYHGTLSNIYDGSMGDRETKPGYDLDEMRDGIRTGKSGFHIFKSQRTGSWYYTYYMPMGINNWSMQLTIDESTAFSAYLDVNATMLVLMVCVIILMVIHVLALMFQNARANQQNKMRLHKTRYINTVQRALLNAHNNPAFVDQALKIVAEEIKAETVLLLTFADKRVSNAQYWPSKDKAQAMDMIGRNIRDDFPMLFDVIASRESVVYDKHMSSFDLSETARRIFDGFNVENLVLVPITDTVGALKGAIAAVNVAGDKTPDTLECVTYDFFMAIANLENHNIIKNMGVMDYLTGIKNRNSYEAELADYATMDCENLWCVFVGRQRSARREQYPWTHGRRRHALRRGRRHSARIRRQAHLPSGRRRVCGVLRQQQPRILRAPQMQTHRGTLRQKLLRIHWLRKRIEGYRRQIQRRASRCQSRGAHVQGQMCLLSGSQYPFRARTLPAYIRFGGCIIRLCVSPRSAKRRQPNS